MEFHATYRPVEQVGGDIFDVYEIAPNRFRVFIADVTGHGVQASMRTILAKTEYDRLKVRHRSPHHVLQELSTRLFRLFPAGEMMATACCLDVVPDGEGAQVTYANAAGPPLAFWPSKGSMLDIYCEGPFLAVDESVWPDPLVFRMGYGDTLVVYTDGLSEQTDRNEQPFEYVMKTFRVDPNKPVAETSASLLRDFESFNGNAPLADDVTLVCLRLPTTERVE